MKDEGKSKRQTLNELEKLRQRVVELETEVEEHKRLHKMAQEYQNIIESSQDMIAVVNQHYRYVLVNSRFLEYHGLNKGQVVGRLVEEVLGQDVYEKEVKEKLDACLRGESVQYVMKYTYPGLGERTLLVSYSPIEDSDGINQVVSGIRDITDYRRAEDALLKTEERLKLALSATHIGVWEWNIQTNAVIWSPECYKIYGVERSDGTLKSFTDLLHPEDVNLIKTMIDRALADRTAQHGEYRIIRPSGEVLWISDIGQAFFDETGNPLRMVGIIQDVTERRRMEEALLMSKEKFRDLYDRAPVGYHEYDMEGRITSVNRTELEMLGYTAEEMIGQFIWEFSVEEEVRQETLAKLAGTLPLAKNLERAYQRKDGTTVPVMIENQLVLDEKGRIKGIRSTVQDISEHKRAEEALRESQALLHAVMETTSDPVYVKDRESRILMCNPALEKVAGKPAAEIIGKTDSEYYEEPVVGQALRENDLRVMESGRSQTMEETAKTPDGYRIFLSSKAPYRNESGDIVGIIGISHDITERKEVEEAQRKSQQLFSTLFRANPGATILSSFADGKCVDANEAYAKLTGYTREELIGKTTVELNIWISAEERQSVVTELARKGHLENVELTLRRKTGEVINTIASGEVITLDGQRYILSFFFDITERKRAEEKRQRLEERLSRAEKMEALGTLSGGVAHDLNNVLGVLVGYSELLLMEMGETNPLRSHVSYILQASQKAAAIVQDLLTLARRGVSVSKVVNLNDVISSKLKTVEYEMLKLYHPTVTFKWRLEKDLLNVKGSPVHLEKTVMNLLSNATEAIADQGEVTIVTENRYLDKPITGYDHIQEGDYVVLRVSDNGRGISAADIGKIFEPFYTKKLMGRSGTGLGLAVVWGTVKDHRGYIDVQSEEGRGSTFTLYFPVTREERVSDQREISAESYIGRGESILVVDDVNEQRELATTMLSRLGYRVSSASSGEEAVIYLKTNRVDLLVLDMIMDPGMDGLETYQKVLEINPRQKVIIMSGFSETDRVKKAQELGAGTYVRKPYIQEKIGLAIRKELDK